MVLGVGALGAAVQVGARHVVDLDEPGLAARLDGHVRDAHALVHVHGADGAAGELHGLVERAVHADHADDVQDDVLAGDAGSQLALDLEQQRLGHLEPRLAGGVAHTGVGGAHARGERAQRAVRAGVAVRADDEVARADDALLGEQRMLDAHAAHLVVVGDTLLAREIAHDLGLLGALDVLVGDVVIGDESDLRRIEHLLDADLAELFDGNGGGDVVGQHEVEIAFDQLTRLHFVEPRMGGEDLLRHGHGTWHVCSFVRWVSGARASPHGPWKSLTIVPLALARKRKSPAGLFQCEAIYRFIRSITKIRGSRSCRSPYPPSSSARTSRPRWFRTRSCRR